MFGGHGIFPWLPFVVLLRPISLSKTNVMQKTILLNLFSILPLFLFAEYFTIENYHIQLSIDKYGKVQIHEKIDVNFLQERRGILRNIPYQYDLNGKKFNLEISNIRVDNWEYKDYKKGGDFIIRFGNPDIYISGHQSYSFSYTLEGALIDQNEYQEFYYDLVGNGWDTKIQNFTYIISLPPVSLQFNDYKIFSGKYGEIQSKVSIRKERDRLLGESAQPLNNNESVTMAIKFPANFFANLKTVAPAKKERRDKTYPIPLAFLAAIFGWWWSKGKNRNIPAADELVQYPPEEMNPAEIGMLVDNRAHTRDMLSLLPYWGNLGYLKMITMEDDDDLIIEKLSDIPENVPNYQKTLFKAIFKLSDYVPMSTLKEKIYSDLNSAQNQLKRDAYQSAYYDGAAIKNFRSWPMLLLFFLSLALGIILIATMGLVITGAVFIVASVVFLTIRLLPPKKSQLGENMESQIKSFKNFLKDDNQEALDSILRSNPKYFENMFPYAVALGLEKSFSEKFKEMDMPAPAWYYMSDANNNHRNSTFSDFSSNYQTESIQSAFTSTPASSSGGRSYSGGGGYSGGGVGGGGGSSW